MKEHPGLAHMMREGKGGKADLESGWGVKNDERCKDACEMYLQ